MLDKLKARMGQIGQVFSATRRVDDKMLPLVIAAVVLTLAITAPLGWWLLGPWFGVPTAVLLSLLAGTVTFGRRASKAQFTLMRGQPGAAAAILEQMRGAWVVTPAVAVTRQQDLVHRVIGKPGVVLVGEGRPARTRQLLKQEQRKVQRVVGDTPVHTVLVGEGEDQVDLAKLRSRMLKLPKGLGRKQIPKVNKRLEAFGGQQAPIPKGPIPGGVKMPRPKRR